MLELPTPSGIVAQPYSRRAIWLWTLASVVAFLSAAWAASRTRARLGLAPLAFPFAAGLVLLSFPVVFAMERGSCDWLMLVPIVGAGRLLGVPAQGRARLWREFGAGALIGLAAWIKLYPAMLVLALLALRRWRSAIAAIATMVLVGMASLPWVLQWMDVIKGHLEAIYPELQPYAHTLSGQWSLITKRLGPLASLPGLLGAGLVLAPLAAWVARRLLRQRDTSALSLPVLLWTTALATFLPTISFDYNLFYLPLAAVAVWDRRDGRWIHAGVLLLALAMQPWAFVAKSGGLTLLFEVAGLAAVGASLAIKLSSTMGVAGSARYGDAKATPPSESRITTHRGMS